MHSDTAVAIRCQGLQAGVRSALVALACIGLAGCGGGPGGRQPDLVVESPSVSADRPAAGASFTFSATVRNAGDRSAAATTLRVYRSDDDTITTDDEQVGAAATVDELAASATGVASVELTAPSSGGTYYYGACVDAVAGESDTANNCSAAVGVIVQVQDTEPGSALPDLVVESPAVSAGTPAAGASFTFSATVRNADDGNAAATTIVFYRSEDETITTSDQEIGDGTVTELAASATSVASVDLTAPSSSGTYHYGACVEAVEDESDPANNCSAAVQVTVQAPQIRVAGPDLIVAGPWVDNANPAIGGVFKLSAEVRNHGRTTATMITLRFYLSTDATITRDDTELATLVRWLGLNSYSEEVYQRVYVKTPSTKGTYYYGACVDAVAGESATTNNCSDAVTVETSHNKPDLRVGTWAVFGFRPVGQSLLVATRVYNAGGPSEATTLRLLLLPGPTSEPSDRTQVAEVNVPKLVVTQAQPASTLLRVEFQAPATSGRYLYVMCVDAVPRDSDTTNDCSLAAAIEFR